MKVNEKYSAIIEWIIAIVLVFICLYPFLSDGNFSPVKEHEKAERNYHYGPSKIVKTISLDKEKVYLCRYKNWFSADDVERGLIKWHSCGPVCGILIDNSRQVYHSWFSSFIKNTRMITVYGYAGNPEITAMLLSDESGTNTLMYDLDDTRMFIFYFSMNGQNDRIKYLRGLDKDKNVIYEEKLYGF